ncbi:aminopeptidase N [Simiduia sp. 21SJ11W-1]|uniref:aminopeptidase N n=1 Tax=Simiduia sp. 21SJ11W-1 TaxID=2909669 RepID=UPI00209E7A39|nr:aminopeptidase N [Simiduia sp. 21SJ11W-1]UTA47090.1 aminopeptidase N [Simiduia sp. 21SJ11W-1]
MKSWFTSIAIVALAGSALLACTNAPDKSTALTRKDAPLLERHVAAARAERVSNVHYKFALKLPADNVPFTGTAHISFDLSDASRPLTLDMIDGEVQNIELNGKPVAVDHNGFYITLPASALSTGKQALTIHYTHPYRRDGSGLHWFKDPEDGETYLYTQFEDYHFNKVFPGFDQPDLKATYTLVVDAPAHWQVISAKRESQVEPLSENYQRWHFPRTELFSTYIFSLHAGPYKVWEDNSHKVPMRLFARQSYAQYVGVEQWFEVTRQGMDFFEQYFEYDYPFSKYDQVLVPDFNFGAMENVGAVTFTERLQPRRAHTRKDQETMTMVVMHELAHHWFGNLVTMKWWDDIWLNESFADFMGYYATAKATEFTEAMDSFSGSRKSWGYNEDQWITSHPIVQDIPDTEVVMASIDGITYAKGASALIQLKHYIGDDKFQQALALHFDRYAFKNAQLKDFLATLSEVAGEDLSTWSAQWLETAGVNALQAKFSCDNGAITHFDMVQYPANVSGSLRTHKLDALLIGKDGNKTTIDVNVTGASNPQPQAVGKACPAFVLPNVSDYTFARILLDEQSVDYLQNNLGAFKNPIQKAMIWRSLYESMIDGKLSATALLDLGLKNLPAETNPTLLRSALGSVETAYSYLVLRPYVRNTDGARAALYRKRLEQMAWQGYQKQAGAAQRAWFGTWLSMLHTQLPQAITLLEKAELSLDDRWRIAGALVREQHPNAEHWVAKLSEEDQSAGGKVNQAAALSQAPNAEIKRQWINEATQASSEFAYSEMRSILWGLIPVEQHGLNLELEADIMAAFNRMTNVQSPVLQATFAGSLIPRHCSLEAQATLLALAENPELPATVVKTIKKTSQAEARCVKVQQKLDAEL